MLMSVYKIRPLPCLRSHTCTSRSTHACLFFHTPPFSRNENKEQRTKEYRHVHVQYVMSLFLPFHSYSMVEKVKFTFIYFILFILFIFYCIYLFIKYDCRFTRLFKVPYKFS